MPTPRLSDDLFDRPYEFDFFQAVYLLELANRDGEVSAVGRDDVLPKNETVRFRGLASLSFPPSVVYDLERPAGRRPPLMTVAFGSLYGPGGALPDHYTEFIINPRLADDVADDSGREERTALREWLDLFNHRLTTLFYRTWEKYRPAIPLARYLRTRELAGAPVTADALRQTVVRQAQRAEPDTFTKCLFGLVGLGVPRMRGRLRVAAAPDVPPRQVIDDLAVLYYGGLFAQRPRNAAALASLVGDYFGFAVRVIQFSGQWLAIPKSQQSEMTEGGRCTLGRDAVAGERVWDVVSCFRLRIGPLRLERYLELLPDRDPHEWRRKTFFLLCQLVRLYVGPEFDFEVQLVLAGPDVPECALATVDAGGLGARLGWNTWLKVGPTGDVDDACFPHDTSAVFAPQLLGV
jgi:type VI secretion system protein ImpH